MFGYDKVDKEVLNFTLTVLNGKVRLCRGLVL